MDKQISPVCGVSLGEIGVLCAGPTAQQGPVHGTCTVWLGLLRVVISQG